MDIFLVVSLHALGNMTSAERRKFLIVQMAFNVMIHRAHAAANETTMTLTAPRPACSLISTRKRLLATAPTRPPNLWT